MERHNKAVAAIADRVAHFYKSKTPFRLYHGSTNSTRTASHDPDRIIDTSTLNHILDISDSYETGAIATVEPNVSMASLVRNLLPRDYLPLVVPEFLSITVGGAFSGTAAESSSFDFGYFDATVAWIEIVLADGHVVHASAEENADLFYGAAGACGTLGVVVCLGVRLKSLKGRRFVRVDYLSVHGFADACQKLDDVTRKKTDEDVDFLDAVMYAKDAGVVIIGTLCDGAVIEDTVHADDEPDLPNGKPPPTRKMPIQQFRRWQDPWYYHHVHSRMVHLRNTYCATCDVAVSRDPRLKGNAKELVPVYDYIFRYDRGCFWMGGYGWPTWTTTTLPGRLLFNHWHTTAISYAIMHHANRSRNFIIQDLAIPRAGAEAFLSWTDETLCVYPLWLCPIASPATDSDGKGLVWAHRNPAPLHPATSASPSTAPPTSLINVGLWGLPTSSWPQMYPNFGPEHIARWLAHNRAIEAKVRELGGMKWLYAENFYSEDEFWGSSSSSSSNFEGERKVNGIYDKEAYSLLRQKYGAHTGNLPSLWDKVRRKDGLEGPTPSKPLPNPASPQLTQEQVVENAWDNNKGEVGALGFLWAVVKATMGRDHLLAKAKSGSGRGKGKEAVDVEGNGGEVGKG